MVLRVKTCWLRRARRRREDKAQVGRDNSGRRREPPTWEVLEREVRRLESRRGGIGG